MAHTVRQKKENAAVEQECKISIRELFALNKILPEYNRSANYNCAQTVDKGPMFSEN